MSDTVSRLNNIMKNPAMDNNGSKIALAAIAIAENRRQGPTNFNVDSNILNNYKLSNDHILNTITQFLNKTMDLIAIQDIKKPINVDIMIDKLRNQIKSDLPGMTADMQKVVAFHEERGLRREEWSERYRQHPSD